MHTSQATLSVLFVLAAVLDHSPAQGQSVYWTGDFADRIWRAALDGSSYEEVVIEEGTVFNVVFEPVSRTLYWTTNQGNLWFIKRARMDGSDPRIVIEIKSHILGLAIDPASGSIFLLTIDRLSWRSSIHRADLDGSNLREILTSDDRVIYGVTVDTRNAKLYWTETDPLNAVLPRLLARSDLDATNVEEVLTTTGFDEWIQGIALDPVARRIYWTAGHLDDGFRVRRAHYDGSNIELLFDVESLANHDGGRLEFDPMRRQFYWDSGGWGGLDGMIARSNFDGSARQGMVAGLESLGSFAVDLRPAVTIDILPGRCPNQLSHRGGRSDVIPVAILGSHAFDPRWVDWSSVTLARFDGVGEAIQPAGDRGRKFGVSFEDVGTGFDAAQCGCASAGPDGIEDAVLHFPAQDVFKAFELDRSRLDGSVGIILRARLRSGVAIEALDCITADPGTPESPSTIVYWNEANRHRILRADVDGTFQDIVATDPELAIASFALEALSGSVYWTSRVGDPFDTPPGSIKRSRIGSADAEELMRFPDAVPGSIVLSSTEGKMYWGQRSSDGATIHRADLDGADAEIVLSLPVDTRVGVLALDEGAGQLYWSQLGQGEPRVDLIRRANLNGTMAEDLVRTEDQGFIEIALDLGAGKLYWRSCRFLPGCIPGVHRANLDGSDIEDLGDLGCFFGGLALDPNGMIYCGGVVNSHGTVQRLDPDGSLVQLIALDLSGPVLQPKFPPGTIVLDLGPLVSLKMPPHDSVGLRDPMRGRADVVNAALIGSAHFDVEGVLRQSLRLSRVDGVGGFAVPFAQHGNVPGTAVADVSAPSRFESCESLPVAPDGIDDLVIGFGAQDVRDAFELNDLEPGSTVEVALTGRLTSGMPFEVRACLTAP